MDIFDIIRNILGINTIIRKLYSYLSHLYSETDPKFYRERWQSDDLFIKLLAKTENADFIGISQSSLSGYLKKTIGNEKSTKLQKMNVFFARFEDGKLWEGDKYYNNIISSIKSISFVFAYSSSDFSFFFGGSGGFDKIISHLTFPIPEESPEKFEFFIEMVSKLLKPEGKFVLSVLNTSVHVESDSYDVSQDFFRDGIYDQLKLLDLDRLFKRPRRKVFTVQEIEKIASQNKMIKIDEHDRFYPFTMKERIAMWKVPAVLNTILDYCRLPDNKQNQLFTNLDLNFSHKKTKDLVTKTFVFQKI